MRTTPRAILQFDTPLGPFVLAATAEGLTHCQPLESQKLPLPQAHPASDARAHLDAAATALTAYFEGERSSFAGLHLRPEGTDFQLQVWKALCRIPFGATQSYRDLAHRAGHPRAARAVGQANHHNPLAILVPCHRVIAADGGLGGYAGGLARKRWLLEHEGTLARCRGSAESPAARTRAPVALQRTTSTGQGARAITRSATLPRNRCDAPLRPWVPITTRS